MPYVITTAPKPDRSGATIGLPPHKPKPVTRRAVARLDEAVDYIIASRIIAQQTDQRCIGSVVDQINELSDSGGTVGPLPDGTTIEVQLVPSGDLYRLLPEDAKRSLENSDEPGRDLHDVELCCAFNNAAALTGEKS